MSIISKT
jgi:hypothetical protein